MGGVVFLWNSSGGGGGVLLSSGIPVGISAADAASVAVSGSTFIPQITLIAVFLQQIPLPLMTYQRTRMCFPHQNLLSTSPKRFLLYDGRLNLVLL